MTVYTTAIELSAAIRDGKSLAEIEATWLSPNAIKRIQAGPNRYYAPAYERARPLGEKRTFREEPTDYHPIALAFEAGWLPEDVIKLVSLNPSQLLTGNLHKAVMEWKDQPEKVIELAKLNPTAIDDTCLCAAIANWGDKEKVIEFAATDENKVNTAISALSMQAAVNHWWKGEGNSPTVMKLLFTHPAPDAVEFIRLDSGDFKVGSEAIDQLVAASKDVAERKGLRLDENGMISRSQKAQGMSMSAA
ncbi:MAG: hypothetical protein COV36_04450 [Alphaproteobacteria bacterium CG11_big_fil_rev_8_21_14_0_20_44_7]|nr:MAG: hypothetical protein COV36_04450 [Alphaproteobacteria bacterium CG11_big_fil_rev_8_21_14_0_20_44_7]